jgi:hypothetical protein
MMKQTRIGFMAVGLLFLTSVSQSWAATGKEVLIKGKVGGYFDDKVVAVETPTGEVKVPRKSLKEEDDKNLRSGNAIRVRVKMTDLFDLNKVAYRETR